MKQAGILPLLLLSSAALAAQAPQQKSAQADAAAVQGFDREPRIAVLIGAGYYPHGSGLAGLRSPSRDVPRLAGELARQGYRVVALEEEEATRGAVLEALKSAAAMVEPGKGTVVFFFVGHGYSVQGVNYLAAFDSSAASLAATGLKLATVAATSLRRVIIPRLA